MKILVISHKHPPALGGMENHNFQLVNGLRSRGHRLEEMIYKGEGSKILFFLTLKKRIKSYLVEHPDTDLIYLNDGLMAAVTRWLPAYTDIPIFITFHGLDLIFQNAFYQKALQKFNRPNCRLICVSRATREQALQRGFSEQNTFHIDNGVDHDFGVQIPSSTKTSLVEKFGFSNPSSDDIWLISVGRAVPRKGFSWFIGNVMPKLPNRVKYIVISPNNVKGLVRLAVQLLPASWSRFLATLSGWTTDYAVSMNTIRANHLQDRVFFLDSVPFSDMINLLRTSDLAVMPNIRFEGDMEGFGLVILEANLCNKFVLASNMEGITSAVHQGRNGALLGVEDSDGWAKAIANILSKPGEAERLGEEARRFTIQEYGWNKMTDAYEACFIKNVD